MAKTSMVNREQRRRKLVQKYRVRRSALRARVVDPRATDEERWTAMLELQKLPRDSMPGRRRNRCGLTGRARGYYRKFGLSRSKLREVVMRGEAPGVVKASW
jgi:small subunit ribosomal protein S14